MVNRRSMTEVKTLTGAIKAILCRMKNCKLSKLNGWLFRNEVVDWKNTETASYVKFIIFSAENYLAYKK